jgi:hypothetical protein
MSSPKAVDPVTEVTSSAAEPKAKKPRGSRAKKEDVEVKHAPASTKESKEPKETKEPKDTKEKDAKTKAAPKRKATGEKHPPFEDIIRECITEATGDVREGVSRPAIKSKSSTHFTPSFRFADYAPLASYCTPISSFLNSRVHRVSLRLGDEWFDGQQHQPRNHQR